ncbi:hypothetical protein [Poseidonibacter lekithochrous]|uniref:hypothetical protein n=1 Tax=Poseidonibacter lekithochrous TaxID=1904463 RepID=UPI0008FCAD2D|nr:hypothetical protein [Poseidonibacter lekithochrous]QKJ22265.1 hypothetical protein ALEK_0984 [Poseidonibacter lekithochrous]
MKRILIVSNQPQRFLDQFHFANEIVNKSKNTIDIKFYIDSKVYLKYEDIINSFEFEIINNFLSKKQKVSLPRKQTFFKLIKKYIPKKEKIILSLKNSKLYTNKLVTEEKKIYNRFTSLKKELFNPIKEANFDVMFINGDRHLNSEPVFLNIAKTLNIPVVIPYMVYFAEEEDLLKKSNITLKKSFLLSKYISISQKKFNIHNRENKYYYSHTFANALEKFGVLSINPWFMGSGCSDILCLPNKYMKMHYVTNGVNEEKINILGDTSYDQLFNKFNNKDDIKKEIISKYELDNKKRIIIIALPQLGEHDILPWDEHWKEIDFLMSKIDLLDGNILISLHPKMKRDEYQFLERKFNCKLLDERLSEVLVISDLFIATFSSTILWSTLCGIKTVVVDFYGQNFKMFDYITSIIKVNDKEKLELILRNTLKDKVEFSDDWVKLSKENVFDGNTIQRYLDLIYRIAK